MLNTSYNSLPRNNFGRKPNPENICGRTLHRKYLPSHTAHLSGYHPKTYWTKQGRDIVDVEQPVLAVAKSWITNSPKDEDIVLEFGYVDYLVTNTKYHPDIGVRGCWAVYAESETNPKTTGINQALQRTIETNSSPSPLLPSYDGGTTIENERIPRKLPNETPTRIAYTLNKKRGNPDLQVEVYFPEHFPWDNCPELAPYRSSFVWWTHKLHERRFVNTDGVIYGKDDYVPIKSAYARQIDPDFRHVVKLAVELEIWERDPYEQGTKSYGYRFTDPDIRHAKRRRVPLGDAKFAKRIDKHRKKQATTRVDRWLRAQLYQLALTDIDEGFLKTVALLSVKENGGTIDNKLEAYHYVLERLRKQEHAWQPDAQGRRYSLVTNLKRELRSLLRVEGKQLQQIDISNSQLTFLALEMGRDACPQFFALCEQGQLYEHVAHHAKTTRAKVKKAITQRALFSENDAACQRSKIMRTFDRHFPEVADYLHRAKDCRDGGSRLAKQLQFAEADFIIDRVCGRLRREDNTKFVTPIHDSLVFLPKDADYIKSVMEDEFTKLGICPKLEVKGL
jgi:hypothetical protein